MKTFSLSKRLNFVLFLSCLIITNFNYADVYGAPIELYSTNPAGYGYYGSILCPLPDITGDGKNDIIVSGYAESGGGSNFTGRLYIINGNTGLILRSCISPNPETSGYFGRSLSSLGDLNGDGLSDVIVGTDETVTTGTHSGRVYIISSSDCSLVKTINPPDLEVSGSFGYRVLGIPDINADGKWDILVSAPNLDINGFTDAGKLYCFSGDSGTLLWSSRAPSLANYQKYAWDIARIPDVNNDGIEDLAVASFGENKTYILSSTDAAIINTISTTSYAVEGIDDLNGDGRGDVIISNISINSGQGQVTAFSAFTGATLLTLSSPYPETNGYFGTDICALDDINGDGKKDIAVGAPSEDAIEQNGGRVYIFSGEDGSFLERLRSTDVKQDGYFGKPVANMGDINGDGKGDILIGARLENTPAILEHTGKAYLFKSGTPGNWTTNDHFDTAYLDNTNWKIKSGIPTLSSSNFNLTNCSIETRLSYSSEQISIELINCKYVSITNGNEIDLSVFARNRYYGFGVTNSSGNYVEFSFWGVGSSQGIGGINTYATLPVAPFNLLFIINNTGTYIFKDNILQCYDGVVTTVNCPEIKLNLPAGSGASMTIDEVKIFSGPYYGFQPVSAGIQGPMTFGSTNIIMTVNNQSGSTGNISVTKVNSIPPGLSGFLTLPYHWIINGMAGKSFSASVTFDYELSELQAIGLLENNIKIFRSDDNGVTWSQFNPTIDYINHKATLDNVTQFSLWAVGGINSSVGSWNLY